MCKVENDSFKKISFWGDQIILNQDTKNKTHILCFLGHILIACIIVYRSFASHWLKKLKVLL
jgi:mannitol/fructose-specific phosphotransferase system IIA component